MIKNLPVRRVISFRKLCLFAFTILSVLYTTALKAQVAFTWDITNGCAPLTVNFTNTSVPPANYFRWTFGDGDTANTLNATHVYSSPGNYNVYLDGWDTTGGGMVYAGQFNGPIIYVSGSSGVFYFSTGDSACPGEQVTLYTNGGFNSLNWDFGDGSPLENWNWRSHTYSDTGTYNVILYITTSCDTDTITQPIYITSSAIPDFAVGVNQNLVCPGDLVIFSVSNGYNAESYQWTFGNGDSSLVRDPETSYDSLGTYQAVLTASNICGNSNSDTLTINVQNGLSPGTNHNMPQNVCPYSVAEFRANAAATTYIWDFGDNFIDSSRIARHFFTDTGNYLIELFVSNGCGNSDSMTMNYSVQYNSNNKPYARISFPSDYYQDTLMVCPGTVVAMTNSTSMWNGSPNFYAWYFGDGDSSDSKDVQHTYSTEDTFLVQMIATNTCRAQDTAYLWVINSNTATPLADLQAFPPSFGLPICPGESVIFIDDGNKDNTEGLSYSIWYGDGDSTLNITNPEFFIATHTYPDTGNFIYTFDATNSCGNTLSVSDTVNVLSSLDSFVTFADNSARFDSMWDNSKCPGDTVQFFAGFGISYLWDFGDGQSDTNQFTQHVYAAAGEYNASVIITSTCGQTDTAYTTAKISDTKVPYGYLSADKTLVKPGDTIFFESSGYEETMVSYSWNFGDGATSTLSSPAHVYSDPGLYTVSLVKTNNCGSGNPGSQSITVVAPVADFSFAFSNNGCTPEMVQFTNQSLYADSFKWNFGDFSPEEFVEDPAHGYGWASTFMVTLKAYNFLTGDSDFVTKPVTITQTPMPGWANFWANPNPVCPNDEVTFNSMLFPPATSNKWYFGDGDSSFSFTPKHTFSDTGNFTVTLIAYNSCGTDTANQVIDVDSAAPVNAFFFAMPNPACPGQQISFNNFSSPAISSLWYFGDGDSSTSTNPAHSYSDTGAHQVTLIAYSSCNSDTTVNLVTVDTSIVPFVFAFSNTDTACVNTDIDFSAFGNDLVAYSWNFGDGFSSLQVNATHSFDTNGTFSVIFTGTNSCGNSNSDTVVVSVINNAPPDANFSFNPMSFCGGASDICPGTNVSFTNYSVNTASFEWDFGDGSTSSLTNPSHSYADTGDYFVRLIATSSCGGKDTVIQCVRVFTTAIPTAWICYNPFCFPAPVCVGTEITFRNNFSTDTTGLFWDFGDGTTSALGEPIHVYSDTGVYTVVLRVTNECGNIVYDTKSVNITNTVSPNADLWAFPNPACPGENINFNAFSFTNVQYFWDFGDGDTVTTTSGNTSHSFDSSGDYGVTMIAFNACGYDTNNLVITIKPGALTNFSFDTVCLGDTSYFSDSSSPVPDSWAWDFGDGITSTIQNPDHLFSSSGIFAATLSTTLNGCMGTVSRDVNVVEISLYPTVSDNSCNGACDGTAAVSANGGIPPYTFIWNNGQTDSTGTGLCAGSYSVTVTDATGCSDTISVSIDEPAAISFASAYTEIICFGTTDGFIDLQPSSAFYTFTWSNFATTEDISSLSSGTYYVTVTDTNSCFVADTFDIQATAVFTLSITKTDISCNGENDGIATATANGTTTPFSYLWSNASSTPGIDSLSPVTYYVTATDSNGCIVVDSTVISEPLVLTVSATSTNVSCNGGINGSATAAASGGTPPGFGTYSYLWSDLSTEATNDSLVSGLYIVTATDANGCTATDSVTVTEPTALTLTLTSNNVSCNGGNDGDATVSASGGTPPYNYIWSNGTSTSSIPNLTAGAYYVTATDSNSCSIVDTVLISEPSALAISFTFNKVSCFGGADGDATVIASGGTAPFSYIWSNASVTSVATNLSAGTYYITVTDLNGCTKSDSVSISEPSPLSGLLTSSNADCFGDNSGSASATGSGGTSPYTYLWSDLSTDASNDSLIAGNYFVTVTDANSCTVSDTVSISQPTVIDLNISTGNLNCFGDTNGIANATISGGTSPYTFLWSNGSTAQNNSNFSGGTYILTATDDSGCTALDTTTIAEPAALSFSLIGDDISCFGFSDGSFVSDIFGGTAPFSSIVNSNSVSITVDTVWAQTVIGFSSEFSTTNWSASKATGAPDVPVYGDITNAWASLTQDGQREFIELGYAPVIANRILIYESYAPDAVDTVYVRQVSTGSWINVYTSTAAVDAPALKVVSCNVPPSVGVIDGVRLALNSPAVFDWNEIDAVGLERHRIQQNNLFAGNYIVTVADTKGCTALDSITISQPQAVSVSVSGNPVRCYGGSDGDATATVTGGTSPYNYFWSNNSASATNDSLPAGEYFVTVTDANGCTKVESITITEPAQLSSTSTQTDATCNTACDGSILLSNAGGIAPYAYSWSDGQSANPATGLCAGQYFVTVVDVNNCALPDTLTIAEPTALADSISGSDVNCNGDSTGSATITVSGGASPYNYTWSTGDSTASVSGLPSSVFTVVVTDANGCIKTDSVIITEPTSLTVSVMGIDVSCNGDFTGSATIAITGGTSPYTFLWSNLSTSQSITGLAAGSYTVSVSDANGCTAVDSVSISEPQPLAATSTISDASCNGACDGTINLVVSGGIPGYQFLWNDGSTSNPATNLCDGPYSVTIADSNNCTLLQSFVISEPALLSSSVSGTIVSCNGGNDGSATAQVSGGTSPYTYLWSSGATTMNATGLQAGNYFVSIIDVNNCSTVDSLNISEPATISITTTSINPSCGNSDGEISATASGGAGGFSFLWNNGQTSASISGLAAATFIVTATDSSGCFSVDTANLSNTGAPTLSASATGVTCFGENNGSIDLSVAGGISPYSFLWSNGETNEDSDSLTSGNYSVTVNDAVSCVAVLGIEVTGPLPLSSTLNSTGISCNAACDAAVTVTVSGGTSPFGYLWSNGSTSATATGLCAGPYVVSINDNKGCEIQDSISIAEPPLLFVSASSVNVTCFGGNDGSASADATGGISPYSYLWNTSAALKDLVSVTAGTYYVSATDANGCMAVDSVDIAEPTELLVNISTNDVSCNGGNDGNAIATGSGGATPYSFLWSNGAANATIQSLNAGIYILTLTDTNACSAIDSIIISEPSMLTANISSTDASCNGENTGSASVIASGGTAPYSYTWNNGQTTSGVTGLSAGTYIATVTDSNGCEVIDSITVSEPAPIAFSASIANPACGASDGEINATVSGGTSPYSYSWSNFSISPTITGLAAGSYSLTITDGQGCNQTVVVNLSNSGAPFLTLNETDLLCNGDSTGAIGLLVSGGSTPYSYTWNTGDTIEDISNLAAGGFSVSVTDASSCIAVANTIIKQFDVVTATTATTDPLCNGTCDGSMELIAAGGLAPYNYLWSDTNTDSVRSGLCAGGYYFTVTDANGCVYSDSATLNEPAILGISITASGANCNNVCNGAASAGITGGLSPFTYIWSNGEITSSGDSLCAGDFGVTVTDSNGCTAVDTAIITEPTAISLTVSSTNTSCNAVCDGSVSASATGGTSPYTYSGAATNLCAGNYPVLVTDANGCTAADTAIITEPTAISLTVSSTDASCNAVCDGSVSASATGGTSPFTYTGEGTSLCAGNYPVLVTDANGCTAADTAIITEPSAISLTVSSTDASCNAVCDGSVSASATGGTSPYTYTGAGSSLCAGNYPVLVTDSNGCTAADNAIITEPAAISLTVSSTDANCNAVCDGSVSASATGGTSPYTYTGAGTSLCVGNYPVLVTDANGCTSADTAIITEPTAISLTISASDASCNAVCDGSVSASATGGTSPYTYTGVGFSLCAGTYPVLVTDANGCTAADTAIITEPTAISLSVSSTDASCNAVCDGSVSASATGGTSPYTYSGAGTNLCAGNYSVSAIDANGCSVTDTATLIEPSEVLALASTDKDTVCNGDSALLSAIASGGSGPYSYSWNNSAIGDTQSVSPAIYSCYSVVATDLNGCVSLADTVCVDICVGIKEALHSGLISLFPNPVRNEINLKISLALPEELKVTLVNSLGQRILLYMQKVQQGEILMNFDAENLATGAYYIEIMTGEGTRNLKFIKVN